jgi:hypothetical protein
MRGFLVALVFACSAPLLGAHVMAEDVNDPFRTYDGKEPVPEGLRKAYAAFARNAKDGGVAESSYLPYAVNITREARPEKSQEYGQDINLPFLRERFSPLVWSVRKDPDDCYLVRTGTTAIWFVQTKSGAWKIYHYLDKPIR